MNRSHLLYEASVSYLDRCLSQEKHLEEDFLGFYHENCPETLALLYLDEKACELHGVKMKEVTGRKNSPGFMSAIMHPEDVSRCDAGLWDFAQKKNEALRLTYLQRLCLLDSEVYKLYFTCFRLNLNRSRFQCVTICLEDDHEFSHEVNQLLQSSRYIHEHIQVYTRFTPREREIISLVCQGKSTLEIAEQLFRSRHTIEKHKKNIFKKGDFQTNSELIRFALCFNLM